jgi:O-antigen/teichoic acid export membrane protein
VTDKTTSQAVHGASADPNGEAAGRVSGDAKRGPADAPSSDPAHGGGGLADTVRGFGVLALSSVLGQLVGFIALAVVTRRIGPAAMGEYTFALTYIGYFALLPNGGVQYTGLRDASADPDRMAGPVVETVVLQLILLMLTEGAAVLLSHALAPNDRAAALIPILGVTMAMTTATLDWVLLVKGRRVLVAAARLAGQVVYAALVPFFVLKGGGAAPYAWLNAVGLAVTALVIAAPVLRLRLKVVRPTWRRLWLRLRRSAGLTYSLAMIQIYIAASVIILGYFKSPRQVGIYAVAYRLPSTVTVLANMWIQAFFPGAVTRLAAGREAFRADLSRVLSASVILALAIASGAAASATRLMPAMFGHVFRASAAPFAILAGAMAMVVLEAVLANVLIAGSRDRLYAGVVTAAAVCNVVTGLLLIPSLSADGAALATLSGEAALVVLTLFFVSRQIGFPDFQWARIVRGGAAVGLMCLVLVETQHVPLAYSLIAGIATLAAAVVVLRPFDPALWKRGSAG